MIAVAEYMRENAYKYSLDKDLMYVLGLLHDIGYLKGRIGHEKYGYEMMQNIFGDTDYIYDDKYKGSFWDWEDREEMNYVDKRKCFREVGIKSKL